MDKQGRLGFALIGAGAVSPNHARAIEEMADAQLVVVCDKNEKAAAKLVREQNLSAQVETDYEKAAARDDVDVVDVCVPPFLHLEVGSAAARAGKHVVVEKPTDISLERGEQLVAACRQAGVKMAGIFQSRYKKSHALLKRCVDEGRLGKLVLGDAYVKWQRTKEYYASGDWRGTLRFEGGGAIINQTIHNIDTLQWIMGPVDDLFARATTRVHDIEVEDLCVVSLRYRNGALGVIEGATCIVPGQPDRLAIHGETGTVILESGQVKHWDVQGMDPKEVEREVLDLKGSGAVDPMAFPHAWHQRQLQDMVDAIREDREPLVNGEEQLKSLRIVDAIYRSARAGEPVKL